MHNHVLAAALLNRTLVVPEWIIFSERNLVLPPDWANETSPHHRKFDLRVLWDLAHMKRCLGPRHVMTVDEYSASQERPGPIRLSLIHCWFGKEVGPWCTALSSPSSILPIKIQFAHFPQLNHSFRHVLGFFGLL